MLYSDDSSNSRKLQSMVKLCREIINRWTCEVFFSLSKTIPLEGCHLRLSGKEINQSEVFESEYNKCTYENISSVSTKIDLTTSVTIDLTTSVSLTYLF